MDGLDEVDDVADRVFQEIMAAQTAERQQKSDPDAFGGETEEPDQQQEEAKPLSYAARCFLEDWNSAAEQQAKYAAVFLPTPG